MTTKTFDSTVSQILQDNSSVEYVEPQDNSLATTPNGDAASVNALFDFNAKHNGEACIESLRTEDAHTPNAFRFTIAMLCTIYAVPKQTMHDNIDSLLDDEEIAQSDISYYAIPGGNNRTYETALYNLTVLNRLGMCCFRKNKEAKKVRDKFNDVLVKHETQAQPTIYDYARALIAEKERSDALEAQNKALEAERDEAIRTKAMIGSRREATAMATASAKSRECEKLREQIGDSETYKRATAIPWLSEYFDTRNNGLYNSLAAQLKKIEASMPPEFAHKPSPDSRFGSVKAYHIAVIEKFHELVREKIPVDKEFMKNYRKDVSPKTKNA